MTIAQYFVGDAEVDLADDYAEIIAAFEEVTLLTMREDAQLNDVLRLVGRRLCELLDVSRCSVYLRRDDGLFQGRVGYCIGSDIDSGVSRLVSGFEGDDFTAEIVATRSPVLVRNAIHDPRTVKKAMRRWSIRNMLGVPLVVEDEVIGILYVDDQDRGHDYDDREVKLAQAFAGMTALAVRHRWLYEQAEERAAVIERQRRVLLQSSVVHNRVTRAILDGEDIPEILRIIVGLVGKPVVLYSPSMEVASWAVPAGLDGAGYPGLSPNERQLPWVRRTIAQLNSETSTVMLRATPETGCRRLMVRMLIDHQCAGYLEMSEIGRGFTPVDGRTLEQASTAVAMKLLSDQRRFETYERDREEHLADLLYARRHPSALRERAAEFGIDIEMSQIVLRLQSAEGASTSAGGPETGRQRRDALARLLGGVLGDLASPVAHTSVPGAVLMLLQLRPGSGNPSSAIRAALEGALDELVARFEIQYAVLSERCHRLEELPVAAERARGAAELLRETGSAPLVVPARELGLLRLVTEREGLDGAARFANHLLAPLIEHDATAGSDLIETLRAYIDADAQVRQAAKLLDVHENTVRYRLGRVRDLSDIEPERFDSLLDVALALKVTELSRTRGTVLGVPGKG